MDSAFQKKKQNKTKKNVSISCGKKHLPHLSLFAQFLMAVNMIVDISLSKSLVLDSDEFCEKKKKKERKNEKKKTFTVKFSTSSLFVLSL